MILCSLIKELCRKKKAIKQVVTLILAMSVHVGVNSYRYRYLYIKCLELAVCESFDIKLTNWTFYYEFYDWLTLARENAKNDIAYP